MKRRSGKLQTNSARTWTRLKHFTESEIESFSLNELQRLGFYCIPGPAVEPEAEDIQPLLEFLGKQSWDSEASPRQRGAGQPLLATENVPHYGEPEKRASYGDVVLKHTLEHAINRLNPSVPEAARQEALKAALYVFSPQLIDANETFHKMLAEGVPVTVRKEGLERGERVWLVDFQNPDNNDFFAINQFTVVERNQNKRPDIILYVNGLPLVVILPAKLPTKSAQTQRLTGQ